MAIPEGFVTGQKILTEQELSLLAWGIREEQFKLSYLRHIIAPSLLLTIEHLKAKNERLKARSDRLLVELEKRIPPAVALGIAYQDLFEERDNA